MTGTPAAAAAAGKGAGRIVSSAHPADANAAKSAVNPASARPQGPVPPGRVQQHAVPSSGAAVSSGTAVPHSASGNGVVDVAPKVPKPPAPSSAIKSSEPKRGVMSSSPPPPADRAKRISASSNIAAGPVAPLPVPSSDGDSSHAKINICRTSTLVEVLAHHSARSYFK